LPVDRALLDRVCFGLVVVFVLCSVLVSCLCDTILCDFIDLVVTEARQAERGPGKPILHLGSVSEADPRFVDQVEVVTGSSSL